MRQRPAYCAKHPRVALALGLDFSPWGELFVANHKAALVCRWTLDAWHNAIPNGLGSMLVRDLRRCGVIRHDVRRLASVPLLRSGPGRRAMDREVDAGPEMPTRLTDGSGYAAADRAAAQDRDREQSQERDRGGERPSS